MTASVEFNNLAMLISIVIGIGITQLLLSISTLVRDARFHRAPLYLMWFTIVLTLNVEFIWNLRLHTSIALSLLPIKVFMLGPISRFVR